MTNHKIAPEIISAVAVLSLIHIFSLLPALLYAGIPPTLQSDASQRMTKDIMDRSYITPKRIVTKYAGCQNNLIKNENYLLERGNGPVSYTHLEFI